MLEDLANGEFSGGRRGELLVDVAASLGQVRSRLLSLDLHNPDLIRHVVHPAVILDEALVGLGDEMRMVPDSPLASLDAVVHQVESVEPLEASRGACGFRVDI